MTRHKLPINLTGVESIDDVKKVLSQLIRLLLGEQAQTNQNIEGINTNSGLLSTHTHDHGLLTGRGDDDHTQYHNNARGDARYHRLGIASLNDLADVDVGTAGPDDFLYLEGSSGNWEARVIDHGELVGRNDDDHTQYLLVSGLRAMAGVLDNGGFEHKNLADPTLLQSAVTVNYLVGLLANYLKATSNLSDLTSASTARTNLGLGDSATKDVGTGAGDVAAGDHGHTVSDITGYVAPKSVIWAEETSNLSTSTNGGFQWSFGNGATTNSNKGIVITHSCKVIGLSLCAGASGVGNSATVEVYKNGSATGDTITITNALTAYTTSSLTATFAAGDYLNFKTTAVSGTVFGSCIMNVTLEWT